ncbi:fibronectin type III domain-containing protein 1-like [Oncorhynchus clarkii lewisi]|uniref:fibronectin type III domain-containing protein 1-like n=1 Tax=Oncorhynchus clarkii lewisi TaxID=490388 RepID=UPI0039B99705
MASTTARTLLVLFATFCASSTGSTADKPLRPRNVQLTLVDKGLRVSWEPPNELDGRPVDRYNIGYGKSMRTLRFIKVDKDRRSKVLEDVEPGVLHFLKMSAENKEGISKPVYRAETPGGGEWVKLDGFAVADGAPVNASTPARPSPTPDMWTRANSPVGIPVRTGRGSVVDGGVRPSGLTSSRGQRIRRPPQSSSGPRQPDRAKAGTPLLDQRSQHHHHHTQPQADQRNRHNPKLASESIYVVSLQAQRATGRSVPSNRATLTKKTPPEPEEYEAKDIGVRVMSPQSVLISWVDPAIEMEKVLPGGSRHYTVKYREKGESARWEYKETNQRRLLIDTLSADGMYEFSVRISQGDNHGKWSVSVFQRTPESAPSGPPENFDVKPLRGKGTAVTATWDPPEEPNGRIREYIMSYAPAMKPFGMKSVTYRGSTTSAIIDGFLPGDLYIFKIRATNRRGQGPQTKAFSVAMPGGTASSAASSPTQGGRRTSYTPSQTSKQDSYRDDVVNLQLEDVTKEPTTPTQTTSASPSSRRTRPLTKTRSYHSIFSDVRGTVRNRATNQQLGAGTAPARDKGRKTETEDEQEEENKTIETTRDEEEEKLTNEDVEEKKEAVTQNNVVPSTPEDSGYVRGSGKGKDVDEPSRPSLKTEVPSSEGSSSSSKPSYPLRKPLSGRRINSGRRPFSRTSVSGSVSQSKTQDAEKGSASSSSSSSSPSPNEEFATIRKDDTVTNYSEGKKTYDQPSATAAKPSTSTPTPNQAVSEPKTEAPTVGRGSALPGRGYGYGRRKPGILSRGNPNGRVLTGLIKPGSDSTSAGMSQSTLPTKGKIPETSHTHGSHTPRTQDLTHHQDNNDYNDYKVTEAEATKEEEPTSSSRTISTKHSSEDRTQDKREEGGRGDRREERGSGGRRGDGGRGDRKVQERRGDRGEDGGREDRREERGRGDRRVERGRGEKREEEGRGDRREDGGRGDRKEDGGRGEKREEEGRGDRREDGGRGDRKEDGERGDKREEGEKGDKREEGERENRKEEGARGDRREEGEMENRKEEGARGDRREEGEMENRKEEGGRGDRREEGGRGENYYNTPAPPPSKTPAPPASRINPFVKRHQSRFGTGMGSSSRVSSPRADGRVPWSRTASSSSVGAGRPILRGFPSRTAASGAASASGASRTSAVQETSEDAKKPSTLYPLKNGVGAGALKPSLPNRNTVLGESRNPITFSSSSFSSSSSNSSSSSRRDSSEPVHRGSSTREDSSNDHKEDYLYKGSKEMYEWNEKVTDPTTAPKTTATTTTATTTTTSAPTTARRVPQSRAIESVDREATPGRTRPGFVPGSTLPRRTIIGPNGRVRSPLLINRQTGSRFPLRAQPAQSTRLGSSNTNTSSSSSSSSSSSLSQPDHGVSGAASVSTGGSSPSLSRPSHRQTSIGSSQGSQGSSSSSSFSSRDSVVGQGTRTRYPSRSDPHLRSKTPSGGLKPGYGNGHGNGKNGRPNLTATSDKESSTSNDNTKPNGRRYITGPDGAKWVLDLDKGVLMNEDGRVLQDSQGQPKRVVLGEDGRTIFDHQGSPLVNQEGQALFGHGRESQPVVNPKDKFLTVGGKPIIGLDQAKPRTTTTTRPPTTTTPEPTTLPTTTEMSTEETITMPVFPTCPPGTFLIRDDEGFPMLDADGILDCYPEEESSGLETDSMDELLWQTTLPPTTTTTDHPTPEPDTRPFNNSPSNEFDLTGKKRFTAPYVNFIQKDPGAPCSLTEALEYLQVDVLENLLKKDSLATNQKQPPKNKPHNITVVAMEGCHSFVILDWAIPLKDDMVSGYMVHSASYDDVLNNRWSSSASSGSHLAVENLKPNSRYYFKVQAKNVFGLGPVSDTITYVTESDDPLLIERPPGGEPIWIPFSFRYNPQHSACKGSQYVKRTWYRKFVGVVLCNSLRYKIFMGDGLKETFYSIADTFGHGEDHCQFVDSYLDGRTGSPNLSMHLPTAQGYYRSYRQEPVNFGPIGRRTPHLFGGWYECGVPIPGKW